MLYHPLLFPTILSCSASLGYICWVPRTSPSLSDIYLCSVVICPSLPFTSRSSHACDFYFPCLSGYPFVSQWVSLAISRGSLLLYVPSLHFSRFRQNFFSACCIVLWSLFLLVAVFQFHFFSVSSFSSGLAFARSFSFMWSHVSVSALLSRLVPLFLSVSPCFGLAFSTEDGQYLKSQGGATSHQVPPPKSLTQQPATLPHRTSSPAPHLIPCPAPLRSIPIGSDKQSLLNSLAAVTLAPSLAIAPSTS